MRHDAGHAAGLPADVAVGDAAAADAAALALRAALDHLTVPLARATSAFVRRRAWTQFGHARLDDHARERFGRSGRWVNDLAAVGEAAGATPALFAALSGADGGRPLGRVAAIMIARAAPRDAIGDWIAFARRESVRDLREALRLAREAGEAGEAGEAREAREARETGEAREAGDGAEEAPAIGGCAGEPGTRDGVIAAADADQRGGGASPVCDHDPDGDRVLFRLLVPLPVRVAFDEALDLFRAVEGRDATVTSFVEALVGEARTTRPVDAVPFVSALVHGQDRTIVEGALRHATQAWETLPPPAGAVSAAAALAGQAAAAPRPAGTPGSMGGILSAIECSLARFREIETAAGHGDEPDLDRQIRACIALENDLEARLGALLAEMTERGLWARLMFASVGHYAEERLGLSRSRTGERVRLARALRGRPVLAVACARGEVSIEAAAIIHRLIGDGPAGADAERAWVRHASVATVKRLRDEARAIGRYRVRVARACVDAISADRGRPGRGPAGDSADGDSVLPLADELWQASLRREAGTTRARVFAMGCRAIGIEPRWSGAAAGAGGASAPREGASGPDVFRPRTPGADVFRPLPAGPDVFLRLRLPGDLALDLVAVLEAARSDLEATAAAAPWDELWSITDPTPSQVASRIEFIRGRRLPMWVALLALLEEFAQTWDHDAGAPEGRDDAVFIRDGWRCAAPGCTSRRHLEDHHIVYRSQGGGHGHGNRVCLCRFHHQRGEHGGLMSVRGEAPLALTWSLGRPGIEVGYRNERRIGAI